MNVSAIGAMSAPYSLDAVSSIAAIGQRDNEKTERIPDNESRETQRTKAPLAEFQGQNIDTSA
jgi:hypothetical protein